MYRLFGQENVRIDTTQPLGRDGVRVRKGVVVDGVSYPVVKLSIESTGDTPVAIRLREELPDGYAVDDLGFHADYDGHCWRLVANDALEFSRCLASGDVTVTAYTIYGSAEDARRFADGPTIDTVAPIDPEDLEDERTGPLWRSSSSEAVAVSAGEPLDGRSTDRSVDRSTDPDTERSKGVVAIPAYNEASSITDVVRRSKPHADEVIVVDDGSTDGTATAASSAGATVVEHDRNRGYGAALKTAFAEAERRDVAWLAILDGDGQHDPADVPELVERQADEDADIVIGSRFVDGCRSDIPALRRVGLWIVNRLTNLSMGASGSTGRIRDTQSGFRVYAEPAIELLVADDRIDDRMGASLDVLYCARRCGLSIVEVGTTVSYDVENRSTHNPFVHGFELLATVLRTAGRDHPIALVGVPGVLGSLLALYAGHVAAIGYGRVDLVPPSVLLAFGTLFFFGLLGCFAAIVSHAVALHTPAVNRTTEG